jgi:capsular polysaccharide biosynthesis protein
MGYGTNFDGGPADDERVLSLGDILSMFRRRLPIILLVALICCGLVVGFDLAKTPTYTASTTIIIGQVQKDNVPTSLAGDVQGLEQFTETMAAAIPSRPVAQEAINRLQLDTTPEKLLDNLNVEQVEQTLLIKISYQDPSAERAKRVSNTVAAVFGERISKTNTGSSQVTSTVWDSAVPPNTSGDPEVLRDGLLALILGLMVGIGMASLLEYLGAVRRTQEGVPDELRLQEAVEQLTGMPTLATIPNPNSPGDQNKEPG